MQMGMNNNSFFWDLRGVQRSREHTSVGVIQHCGAPSVVASFILAMYQQIHKGWMGLKPKTHIFCCSSTAGCSGTKISPRTPPRDPQTECIFYMCATCQKYPADEIWLVWLRVWIRVIGDHAQGGISSRSGDNTGSLADGTTIHRTWSNVDM